MVQKMMIITLVALLSGCASEVRIHPVTLRKIDAEPAQIIRILNAAVSLTLDTGYSRNLKSNSRWVYVGDLPMGKVLQCKDDVFSIEGKHSHEAYLVVQTDLLVGFYLPAEKQFSSLAKPINLNFN